MNLFTNAVPDTLTSWLGKFSFVRLVLLILAYDGVGVRGTRRAIREYKHAHGVPGHAKISQQLWA